MKDFKTYHTIEATPEQIFNALTNPLIIELWTDADVEFDLEKGAEFSLYDGDIVGKILDFIPNKMLVQEWYFGNPEGKESIATIKLHGDKSGTSVEIRHTNIPDDAFENISNGWIDGILLPIQDIIEE